MLILGLASALALAPAPSFDEAPSKQPPPVPAIDEPTVPLVDALVVHPGATCLERDRLVSQIRTWFDRDRIDARLVVEVVGDEHDPLKLAFSIRRGEQVIAVRRFEPAPDRCADLHAVVGLAIALAIDATLLESVAGNPRRPPDPPPRPPDPPLGPEVPRRPAATKPRPWRLSGEVAAQLSIGAPLDVGGGARLGLRTSWRRILDLSVGALVLSSGREAIGDGSAVFSAVAGRFDVCAGPPWPRLRPRGCVGVIAGAALAAGQGFETDRTARLPWVAIPFGVDLEINLAPRIDLVIGIEGVPAVVRPTFEVGADMGRIYVRRFSRFGGLVEAGLSFSLW
ncbi:MAG: hypothetical protein IAG13_33970 [Deltaproteobacteria bacterium]|nr:hypothetical protein [Nannocystaceae bacterium]